MNGLCLTELHLRSEDELILACASTKPGGRQCKVIRRLAGKCHDWDYLLQTARYHGLTPLVGSNLDNAAADIVPCQPLEVLRQQFRANAARNLFLTQELLSLVSEFDAEGIEVIPLKGPLLAMTAYGNVALREFLDLDVLVRKQHLNRAGQLLMRCGYQQPAVQTGEHQSIHIEAQLGCDFLRGDGKASVELHWSFLQKWLGFEVDLDALWRMPEHVSVGGVNVRSLPAEIALLYLCAHGSKHRWIRLAWVVDVAQLLRAHPGLDWDELLKTAKRIGSRRTLFLGLHLARTLIGVDLPEKVLTQIERDDSVHALAHEICRVLFSAGTQDGNHSGEWSRNWFHLRTKERWKERLRYLRYLSGWLLLPSPKDKQWIALPARLGWLYIFLRPIRAACDLVRPRSRNGDGRPLQ
jgi:hypothetical protein